MNFRKEYCPSQEIDPATFREMAALVQEVVPGSQLENVLNFIQVPQGGEYCLLRNADSGRLLAYNYYHTRIAMTPFSSKPLPVVHFGGAYKHPELRRFNIIWEMGRFYARRKLGPFWYLKRFVGITRTVNPRVAESWTHLFPETYPQPGEIIPKDVHDFNCSYHARHLNMEVRFEKCPYSVHPFTQPGIEFTDVWEKKYRSRVSDLNEFMVETDMVKRVGERYFLTDRLMHFVGYYDPAQALYSRLSNHRRPGRVASPAAKVLLPSN
ncbi:MAG: hypothetical protein AAF998_00810 [Bacteroidota bacterium]